MKQKVLLRFAFLTAMLMKPVLSEAQVVINEVMAQNSSVLKDPDYGESADWVELYNSGLEDVDLVRCLPVAPWPVLSAAGRNAASSSS